MSLFIAADACLSWSLHPLQSSKSPLTGFLCSVGWKIQALFKHSTHTNCISSSAILRNNYISLLSDLCACEHVKKNGAVKEAIVLQWMVRLASCNFKPGKKGDGLVHCSVKNAAVLCENHRERVTRIWTSPSEEEKKKKKKKKEKHFGRLVTFWFGTFALLFSATGCVVRHENTRRWTVGCYNGS